MALRTSLALFLALNLLFVTYTSATCSKCIPQPTPPTPTTPTPTPPSTGTCPRDALKINLCANVLNLVNLTLGQVKPCCSLIDGLVDLEAAICLCTALKLNILGINLNLPINLTALLNNCGRQVPKDFLCA